MIATLRIRTTVYQALIAHLLPKNSHTEQAAFLFAKAQTDADVTHINVVDVHLAQSLDFRSQEDDYLELTDNARAHLIKRAHDTHTCLIETHSHPGGYPAAFSIADRNGLRETVPHMKWRLPHRPYVAMVFADESFDALIWFSDSPSPTKLSALLLDDTQLLPTNRSLGGW